MDNASYATQAFVDYYDLLMVERTAQKEEIESNFRVLARIVHPDRAAGTSIQSSATKRMQLLNDARDTLLDSGKRQSYNARLDAWMSRRRASSGSNSPPPELTAKITKLEQALTKSEGERQQAVSRIKARDTAIKELSRKAYALEQRKNQLKERVAKLEAALRGPKDDPDASRKVPDRRMSDRQDIYMAEVERARQQNTLDAAALAQKRTALLADFGRSQKNVQAAADALKNREKAIHEKEIQLMAAETELDMRLATLAGATPKLSRLGVLHVGRSPARPYSGPAPPMFDPLHLPRSATADPRDFRYRAFQHRAEEPRSR